MLADIKVQLLSPGDPEWDKALTSFRHDIYHLPGYAAAEAARTDGTPVGILARRGQSALFLPLVLIPGTIAGGLEVIDAFSPYGYPGPLFSYGSHDDPTFADESLAAMRAELAAHGIAGLFVRTHPLLLSGQEALQRNGTLVFHGETILVDLLLSEEEVWRQTRPQTRNAIRRLQAQGVVIERDDNFEHYRTFIDLYYRTMTRNAADALYYFDESYFDTLRSALGTRLSLWLAKDPGGNLVAAAMFTAQGGIVQYHLACTDLEQGYPEAMKLLLHTVRAWARLQGNQYLHLGGGRGAGKDSLFLFKSGFSKLRKPFATWRAVCNSSAYNQAVAAWERHSGLHAAALEGFFPPYRQSFVAASTKDSSDLPAR